jgi:hypothetical protein
MDEMEALPTVGSEVEVARLASLNLKQLRDLWRARFGEPPALRSLELLRHMLAWRIQVAAFGGLDRESMKALKASRDVGGRRPLETGARIAREHRGVMHEVEVLDVGFRYQGRIYSNLSVIAREITGTRWNGWRFFGLTEVKA